MAGINLGCVQVITDINKPEKCGYCKKPDTHYLEGGIWTFNFTPELEQYLLEFGWRRCGKFIYVMDKVKNCCPLYMIRCDANEFKISHSQKKVLRKITNYLRGKSSNMNENAQAKQTTNPTDEACKVMLKEAENEVQAEPLGATPLKKQPRKGLGPDPSKGPCLKAKERRKLKHKASDSVTDSTVDPNPKVNVSKPKTNIERTLENYLNDHKHDEGYAHKIETRLILVNPESPEYKATELESFRIYKAYQIKVHEDPPCKVNLEQYKNFLVTSAVSPHDGYGCYHLQYFIDGKLFMVGVLDLLQNYVSSVYTYYDPDFMFLSPGVYSALTEIALTRKLQIDREVKQWYCMGFYSHHIQKMRYKGEYYPSFLNCPYTHNWIAFDKCLPLLETGKYHKLADTNCQPIPAETYMQSAIIHHNGDIMPYGILAEANSEAKAHKETIKEYCQLVGPDFCQNTIAIFDFL
ncbi:Arginyl-tRNA--protein transferase 1-like [Oopsacas minuta]|uniref:Arginyl-tRNA--protein transferase 1 n=1 Tax=Oopsacas minuta TaxID=111878 RepID=A0AAV7JZG7_9METZ|nr:Arginyl-tRNA--protein transferase 1-like [Oopsacas minuta]